jgi:DNA mismatch repair protein MutS
VDKITFLYKVKRGAAGTSFGLNVAMMAGLPHPLIARASSIADALARSGRVEGATAEVGTGVLASAPAPSGRADSEGGAALAAALAFVRATLHDPSKGYSLAAEHSAAMNAAHF